MTNIKRKTYTIYNFSNCKSEDVVSLSDYEALKDKCHSLERELAESRTLIK